MFRAVALAGICLALSAVSGWADTVRLRISTGEYAPFSGTDLEGGGIVNRRLEEALRGSGYALDLRYMPWKRALESARQGQFDGTSFWFLAPGREAEFVHVGPVFEKIWCCSGARRRRTRSGPICATLRATGSA